MKFAKVIAILCALAIVAAADVSKGTVYKKDGAFQFVAGVADENGLAYGSYDDSVQERGWGELRIRTGKGENEDIVYALGYLEGHLTSQRVFEYGKTMHEYFFTNKTENENLVSGFFNQQEAWQKDQVAANKDDSYWTTVNLLQQQFEGLVKGQQDGATDSSKQLSRFEVQVINAVGDLLDLISALSPKERPNYEKMSREELMYAVTSSGHCSGLIRITPDLQELFSAHVAWFTYASMLRIFKHYHIDLQGDVSKYVSARAVSFSSYPGMLESLDDFYMMDSGLAMVQTTNNIFNTTLYEKVHPSSLLAWQRVRLANWIASTGKQWGDILATHNSGTYNNQYMVVDYKRFNRGVEVGDGTLHVVEQIPGLVVHEDQTPILRTGFWSSYNVPFYEEIYDQSGYPDFVAKHGLDFSYQMAPRAKIFRRDAEKVMDFDGMKWIMRENNYKHDPFAEGKPENAICSRTDMDTARAPASRIGGCYDGKVTSYDRFWKLQADAINGPTRAGNTIPPFSWNDYPNTLPHYGQPTTFDFDWTTMKADW
mmetsp:Transcript_4322/g.8677  ORF Transcript_4322/g.8677 Transcript_4322/m.8677 type:complete len:540 (-) Transcript_4322:179-1798(-)